MITTKGIKIYLFAIALLGNSLAGYSQQSKDYYPDSKWEKVDLKKEGWSAEKLKESQAYAQKLNVAGAMVLYKGKILQEYGDVKLKTNTHSVRKSLLSTMYGLAVKNGLINLSSTIRELGIDDIEPSLSETEKNATVEMLLQARSGIYHPAAYETQAMKESKPKRYSHLPGTYFYYNNWDFNVLGYIYREKTGKDIFQSFQEVIANPTGMQDFDPKKDGKYVYDRKKSNYPAYPFELSTRDMARMGLLIERTGRWKDHQVIPESWIKKITSTYSDGGNRAGYGYLWWTTINGISPLGGKSVSLPDDLVSAKGYKGHVIAIMPKEQIVFVFNNDDSDGGKTSYADAGRLLRLILNAKEN